MYVCLCKGITDSQIRDAVNSGAESIREVRDRLGVMTQCGTCSTLARQIVKDTLKEQIQIAVLAFSTKLLKKTVA